MAHNEVVVEQRGPTAILFIDHPPANTWSRQGLERLYDVIGELESDPEVRSLVVTGRGERFFCAGDDLKTFVGGDPTSAHADARRISRALERLAAFPGMTIAAINGYCLGGGLECALACDTRVCEAHAQLGLPEAGVGILPCGGGTQRLPWLVGEGWAKRLVLCGEKITADVALRIGLVEEVVPQGQALDAALGLAERATHQGPAAVRACKHLIDSARERALAAGLPHEREAFADLFRGSEPAEGVAAFLEKRPPSWAPKR